MKTTAARKLLQTTFALTLIALPQQGRTATQ